MNFAKSLRTPPVAASKAEQNQQTHMPDQLTHINLKHFVQPRECGGGCRDLPLQELQNVSWDIDETII